MSCPYCTTRTFEDGTRSEYCQGFYHTSEDIPNAKVDVRLEPWIDEDDGSMWWTLLMHDEGLSRYIHELGEPSKHAGMIVTSIPAPPFCPFCGRRLYGHAAEL